MVLISLGILLSCQSFAQSQLPLEFELHAQSRIYGMNVKLVQMLTEKNGQYRLEQVTKAPFISISETSLFSFNPQQQLQPHSYDYSRSVFGAKLKRKNTFAADLSSASYKKNKEKTAHIALDKTQLNDQLNFILTLQQWAKTQPKLGETFDIQSLKRKSVKTETYQLTGYEWIESDLGWFETAVIERQHDNDRVTRIWLAKDWHYLLIKMLHSDDDVGEQVIFTNNILLQGKRIEGLKEKPEITN